MDSLDLSPYFFAHFYQRAEIVCAFIWYASNFIVAKNLHADKTTCKNLEPDPWSWWLPTSSERSYIMILGFWVSCLQDVIY